MNNFKLFGTSHLIFLFCEIIMIFLLFLTHKRIKENKKLTNFLRYTFAIVHIGLEVIYYVWAASVKMPITKTLPLELCSLSLYLTALFLVFNNERIWRFSFPVTIIGAAIACLIGTADGYDFPHIRFFQFFISHGLLIITNLFGALVLDFKMGFKEYKKTLLSVYIIAVFVFFINKYLGANYMFLNWAPYPVEFLEDYLGKFYILPIIAVISALYYLPVYALNLENKKLLEAKN